MFFYYIECDVKCDLFWFFDGYIENKKLLMFYLGDVKFDNCCMC